MRQLLKEVVGGEVLFRAILVYDVSRWRRFQDLDEAAHYEYLCKASCVPVIYCAETFSGDRGISSLILKALKRAMAGEYSRELSDKVKIGMFRLATHGYRVGGVAGYGLRRQLLDTEGTPKQLLGDGERKSIATERVILVPGPAEEVAVIRRIFHEFLDEHRSMHAIAERLNRDGIPFLKGATWPWHRVMYLLENPKYAGTQVWGRTTGPLSSPRKLQP